MFLITASVYMCGAVAYGLMASGERQEWSKIEGEDPRWEDENLQDSEDLPRLCENEGENYLLCIFLNENANPFSIIYTTWSLSSEPCNDRILAGCHTTLASAKQPKPHYA